MAFFLGAQAGAQAYTSTYVFTGKSTVVQTGGFAGVNETYPIQGEFQLTVDANAGVASFDAVNANLLNPTGFLPTESLGELVGCVVGLDVVDDFQSVAGFARRAEPQKLLGRRGVNALDVEVAVWRWKPIGV